MTRVAGADGDARTTLTVVALAALSVLARLFDLGSRTFHWDEGRVGYWLLRFLDSGAYEYRPVAGGPFLYVLGRPFVALFGADDGAARLLVALVGGALPLAALLFRDRLRRSETVALAFFLGASPLLLYYSRFLRGDVVLAAFALVTLGCAVRYRDRGDERYLSAAAASLALAVSASAFVVGYLACWLVAGALVFDHRRFLSAADVAEAGSRVSEWRDWLTERAATLGRAVGVYALVHFFLFAPRAGATGGPGLWRVDTLPATVSAAFIGAARKFVGVWVVSRGDSGAGHAFIPFVTHHAELLVLTSTAVVALGALGFAADRYAGGPPRPLVAFAGYWAGTGLLVFPVITEGQAPWVAVHMALPLTVTAAVAGGWLLRAGAGAYRREQAGRLVAVLVVLLALGAGTGAVAASAYEAPDRSDRLVDYGQPGSDLGPLVTDVRNATEGSDGSVDVAFYGEELYVGSPDRVDRPPVPEEWGARLPLPWYLEGAGAETASTESVEGLESTGPAPVVIAMETHRSTLSGALGEEYRVSTYDLALWDRTVVVFVER
jgi:uncharacterized protein (TIGR03663 family)